eukprot:gene12830-biopygen19983
MCNAPMDRKALHALRCPCGGDRTRWHNTLRNHFAHLCESAGLHAEVDAPHLLLPDIDHPAQEQRRPADVFLPVWDRRCPAAFDFAITSPHRIDVIQHAARQGGYAAADYEGFKRTFHDTAEQCEREGITFLPMVFEPSGACGPTAREVFRRLLRHGSPPADEQPSAFAQRLRQKWCVHVRRQAARTVLRRMHTSSAQAPDDVPADEMTVSAAARGEGDRPAGSSPCAGASARRQPHRTGLGAYPRCRSLCPPGGTGTGGTRLSCARNTDRQSGCPPLHSW